MSGRLDSDDTLVATPSDASPSEPPRVRASRASLPPSGLDYPELTVVDAGHYVIQREIARGGMGRIQVARDRRLGRDVAIKEVLINAGSVARRFEREARITARLQHPSIISVHEAGTWPSGEPFYAMPLVTGRSLDEAIAATTTFAERLALLPNVLAVADAMAYAHGQRVIHRDLKPRNIVVGEFGETVVLDWGLAKDLDVVDHDSLPGSDTTRAAATEPPSSQPGETTAGEVLGTPAYMPPEQANGEAVDARADVYAIGALLYHLLAGRPPYVESSNAEVLAAVHAGPPVPLAQRAPEAARELVAIVERAMARDAAARYATARELAEDLRRYQTGQLVGAHRYSLGQLLRRWARRHRTVLIAGATAAVVAIAIGVVAVRRVVRAEAVAQEERGRAIAHQKDAEELMQFMLVDLRERLGHVGKLDLLDEVARRALTYYDAREAGTDDDVYHAAIARFGVGKVLEARNDLPGALAEYRKAQASLDQLVARRPGVDRYEDAVVDAALFIGNVLGEQGELPVALASYRAALVRAERRLAAAPDDPKAIHVVGLLHGSLGSVAEQHGELATALAEYKTVLELANQRARLDHSQSSQRDLLTAHASVGKLLYNANNDLPGALAEYRLALRLGEVQVEQAPKDPTWITDVALSHNEVSTILLAQKDLDGALTEVRAGIAAIERAIAVDPTNTDRIGTRATLFERLGIVLLARKDVAGARAAFQTCDEIYRELTERDPSNLDNMRGRSLIDNKLGDVALASKDTAAALEAYQRGLAIRERLSAKDPTNAAWRRDLFYSHYKLAMAYSQLPDDAKALDELRAAATIADATSAAHPDNPNFARDAASTHKSIGDALLEMHQPAEAKVHLRAALAIAERMTAAANADAWWIKTAAALEQTLASPKLR